MGSETLTAEANATTATCQQTLQRQMAAWEEDPQWQDQPPVIKVTAPKDAFVRIECECILAIPPDMVYNTISDPDNRRVFKNIKGVISRNVLEDDGNRQVVQVQQLAMWKFLFLSGTFEVNQKVVQDREQHTMSFELLDSGLMKSFRGQWQLEAFPVPPSSDAGALVSLGRIAPAPKTASASVAPAPAESELQDRDTSGLKCKNGILPVPGADGPCLPWFGAGTRIATLARFSQEVSPAANPPPFVSHFLRGISGSATAEMMRDFQLEAARLRYGIPADADVRKELERAAQRDKIISH